MTTTSQFFKFLAPDGSCINGGRGSWHLPKKSKPGKWMQKIVGDLVPCERGYHLCRPQDLLSWIGPTLWLVEHRGAVVETDDKVVVREARLVSQVTTWDDRMLRLFACDCAERVVHLAKDQCCYNAIAVARKYANGEATKKELSAAGAAARAAATAASWTAASAAARATTEAAAWAAAEAAAARAAAWATSARATAERKWQTARLLAYIDGKV